MLGSVAQVVGFASPPPEGEGLGGGRAVTLAPLPVTVVAGYLGAGKTSLVNHLLRNPDGRRIMVMVNDFGALDIDAELLVSADEDTLTLANGCICSTMGTELLYALSDACDRRPRPDWLVIEASGVAQPEKIAAAAHAEPEMRYQGVVTLVDAANIAALLADREIGDQVRGQIAAADLIVLTKTDLAPADGTGALIGAITAAPVIEAPHGALDPGLLHDRDAAAVPAGGAHDHGALYESWSSAGGVLDRAALKALLEDPPAGLYRLKGRVALAGGERGEVHLVGRTHQLTPCDPAGETRVVAIGLASQFDPAAFQARWRACLVGGPERG